MKAFLRLVVGLVGLALVAYLVMVAWGVYTALDSATTFYGGEYTARTQSEQVESEFS